jgi:putative salt-induced outer membrane protein YdiY
MNLQKSLITVAITTAFSTSLFFSSSTFAIDETESLRKKSKNKPSFTSLSLSLSGKSGNSDKQDYSLGFYHSERKNQHFGFVMASVDYAESNDVKSEDSAFVHARYNYYFKPDTAFELFVQSNKDEFKSLESRNLLGVSYRKEFSKISASDLFESSTNVVGVGAFQEHEKYNVNDQSLEFDQTRLSLYWAYNLKFKSGATLSNTLYYQPNIEQFSDLRAYNNLSLSSKVTENLSLKLGLLVEHDSRPVLDVKKTDVKYQAGFSYDF